MRIVLLSGALALGVSATAMGQVWNEAGDAPPGVPANQVTSGEGPLLNINGTTSGPSGDWVDTYAITITDASAFYATTSPVFGNLTGTATFDTRLWLWTTDGEIVLGNDDIPPGGAPFLSLLTDPSTYTGVVNASAAGISLVDGDMYLLSIGAFNDSPVDAAGVPLADLGADFDALFGPNTAAGAFTNWQDVGGFGGYSIELGGAAFYSLAKCPEDFDGDNLVGFADLLLVLSNWGPCAGCPEDLDGDNIVGFADLLLVLSNWGPC